MNLNRNHQLLKNSVGDMADCPVNQSKKHSRRAALRKKLLIPLNHDDRITSFTDQEYQILYDPPGDGNCQFSPLVFALRNMEIYRSSITLRVDVINYLEKNGMAGDGSPLELFTGMLWCQYLEERFINWENGNFDSSIRDGRTIQVKFLERMKLQGPEQLSKSFANIMLKGKVTSAVRLLDKAEITGVVPLSNEIINDLREKYPDAKPPEPTVLLGGEVPFVDPDIFEEIDE